MKPSMEDLNESSPPSPEVAEGERADAPPAGSLVETTEDGFPVFRCDADAPARRMSLEELLALEWEALAADDLARAGLPVDAGAKSSATRTLGEYGRTPS